MANSKKIDSSTILKAVDVLVNKRIEELDLDRTIIATIQSPISPELDGSYKVQYNGGIFTAYAAPGTSYAANTKVYVQIPQNDFSKRKIIISSAGSYYLGNTTQAVSSSINDYSIIGNNPLVWATSENGYDYKKEYEKHGFGLNSYTAYPTTGEGDDEWISEYQDTYVLYDKNRINKVPFNLQTTELENSIKQAKAIMISADFRTNLTQNQQLKPGAEYGLVFNLIFKNQEIVYKTNKEICEGIGNQNNAVGAYSSTIDGSVYFKDFYGNLNTIMSEISEYEILNNADDYYGNIKEELNRLSFSFIDFANKTEANATKQEQAVFTAFQNMLSNILATTSTITEIKNQYNAWLEEKLNFAQEDLNQPQKIISYVLDSSNMIGNPFLFSDYINQYAIFPIDTANFIGIDKIVFYCKGFNVDSTLWDFVDKNRVRMYDPDNLKSDKTTDPPNVYRGKDIWVKNIKFLALGEISSEYGDYRFSLETPQGNTFYSTNREDELILQAKVMYKRTNVRDDCSFYWFAKDARIKAVTQDGYNYRAGFGWRYLGEENQKQGYQYTTNASLNKAYENEYLCVAVYNSLTDAPITLKAKVFLFNESCKRTLTIESDLGYKFKFDTGTPTFTCKIDERIEQFDAENENSLNYHADDQFKFLWSQENGNTRILYNEEYAKYEEQIRNTVDYSKKLELQKRANQLKGVSYPLGLNRNQLKYPIGNLINNSEVIFECQVFVTDKKSDENGYENEDNWYSIGTATVTIRNEGRPEISEYRVVIDNGSQVFQYSETGVSPLYATTITPTSFRHTEPIEIKELKAHLYAPNGVEVSEGTYTVKWKYPTSGYSLILPPEELYQNVASNEFDMLEGQTATFSIEQYYDYEKTDNQIQCLITYGNETYTRYTDFYFGKIGDNGTNGTDVVAKIVVEKIDNGDGLSYIQQLESTQPLTAYEFWDENDQLRYAWNTWEDLNLNININPILTFKLYNRGEEVNPETYRDIQWSILGGSGKTNYTINNEQDGSYYYRNSKYFRIKPFDETDQAEPKLEKNQAQLIYYKNEGNNTYTNLIIQASAALKDDTGREQVYYCSYPVCVVSLHTNQISDELFDADNSHDLYLNNQQYLKQILYNGDGRTPHYDKKQGVFLEGLLGRYTKWSACGGYDDAETQPCFSLITELDSAQGQQEVATVNQKGIYILPNNVYDGGTCNNYVNIETYSSKEVYDDIQTVLTKINNNKIIEENTLKAIEEAIRKEKIRHTNALSKLASWRSQQIYNIDKNYNEFKNDIKPEEPASLADEAAQEAYQNLWEEEWYKASIKEEYGWGQFGWDYAKYKLENGDYQSKQTLWQNFQTKVNEEYFTNVEKIKIYYNTFSKELAKAPEEEENPVADGYKQKTEDENEIYNENILYWQEGEQPTGTSPDDSTGILYFNDVLPSKIVLQEYYKEVNDKLQTDLNLIETYPEAKINILVPIYMSLNVYGLASLNAWNGNTVDINEEGGYILAPQMGAGVKNEDNTFTGIVMGELSQYGSDSGDIGLLGLHEGKQSIFLDADTGNAYFGLPTENKYGSYGTDDYNEGRIELIPGGISNIGGWHLGRRSLYYTSSGEIGEPYGLQDYVPDKDGTLHQINWYAKNHEKDIDYQDSGILLYSGKKPYLSIKGRKLYPTGEDSSVLSSNAKSYLKDGDSLEVQLDPDAPTPFTIFRHNGVKREYENEQGQLETLYEEGSRTFLAGINSRGQLVANGLQEVVTNSDGTQTVTTFGPGPVPAFGETIDNATHAGLQMDWGDSTVAKIFIKNKTDKDSTLYMSGASSETNEYQRPISLHGKSISLYASEDGSKLKTTNSKITISEDGLYAGNPEHYISIPNGSDLAEIKHAGPITNTSNGTYKINTQQNLYQVNASYWTIAGSSQNDSILKSGQGINIIAPNEINLKTASNQTNNVGQRINIDSTRMVLGYQEPTINDEAELTEHGTNSYIYLTPSSGVKIRSQNNFNWINYGKAVIQNIKSNDGWTLDWYNTNTGTNQDKGHVNLVIRPNSGISLNVNGDIPSEPEVESRNEVPQFNLQTHDGAHIKHQWGIKPNWNGTWSGGAGWSIKPGILTEWINATEDVIGGGKSLKSHTHPFSKGVTVYVNMGSTNENPGVGRNATLRVDPTATASISSINVNQVQVKLQIQGYHKSNITYYTKNGDDYSVVNYNLYIQDETLWQPTLTGEDDSEYSNERANYARITSINVPNSAVTVSASVTSMSKDFTVYGTSGSPN